MPEAAASSQLDPAGAEELRQTAFARAKNCKDEAKQERDSTLEREKRVLGSCVAGIPAKECFGVMLC